ncbi:D-alanyl-D-alanine carboxypeptidase [Chitinispirillum alkaliphilum]|nr:D-alanyl-D-alanine carboxypeptidase [Chitinispirillum alkaliphilum]
MGTKIKAVMCIVLLVAIFTKGFADRKASIEQEISRLVTNGSVVLHDEAGNPLISENGDNLYIPASIVKILTSAVAIDLLGADFRFKTEFHITENNSLVIKGWGDPFLVSEEIKLIAENLKIMGVSSINQIYVDNSTFSPNIVIPGIVRTQNPYNALNGALVTNFNTLNLRRCNLGNIYSAEEVTPLTPIAISKGGSIDVGTTRRINLSGSREDCLRYAGELFATIFQESGIEIENEYITNSQLDPASTPFYVHYNSRDIVEISKGLQRFSNNFIANQIFLTLGAEKLGYPATLEKGKSVFENYIRTVLGIPSEKLVMEEGSGISRNNKITGNTMVSILQNDKSLSELLAARGSSLVKSGTLTGVYNYAGYIQASRGLMPFVIMLNQNSNHRDRILTLLEEYTKYI